MTTVKYILLAIEIIGLCLFLFPIVLDVINFGNISGTALFAVLIFITVFHDRFFSVVNSFWKTIAGKIIITIVCAVIIFIILLALFLSFLMIKAQTNEPKENTTVIVLGCKVKGENPSRMLKFRLDKAYDYLSDNKDAVCIVSGGQGDDEVISEAECMYNYLVNKGIDKDRIIKEDKSRNTQENIEFSKKIIKEYSLSEDISIVTDGFHQYRASYIAKNCGFENVYALCAHTKVLYLPSYWVREWAAILNEWAK